MIRTVRSVNRGSSVAVAALIPVAAAAFLIMVSLGARAIVDPRAQVIPPNAVGTWRLDSLLDQARIEGMDRSDVDPATFVLQDLRFPEDAGRIEAKATPFGKGTIEPGDGCVHLKATGTAAQFLLTIPETRANDWGLVAASVRPHGVKEIALRSGDFSIEEQLRNYGGMNALMQGRGPIGGSGAGVLPLIPPQVRPGAPRAPADAAAAGKPAEVNPAPAPTPGVVPNPPTAGGGNLVIQAPGGQMVLGGLGGQGGLNGPGANIFQGMDPRPFLAGSIVTLADSEEWQPIGRTKQQFGGGRGLGGLMGGNNQPPPALKQMTLILLVPEDKKESGVEFDLQYVHVLDSKADYAKATAAATTVERKNVLHAGIYLNTPSTVSYTLVAPEKARLVAGLTALSEQPFDFFVHVTSPAGRKTVFHQAVTDPAVISSVDLDLSEFAGQTITLTLEVVEQEEATVAFLLQPLLYGKRKEGVRNALLYFCDTLRADGLSSYGNARPTTPNLDRIASEGVRFERCFSQGSWTPVSMPSSLSSLTPSVSGVKSGGGRIPDSAVTMAEVFRNAGYLTCALIRNDFVGPGTNTQQGFDFFFQAAAVGTPQTPEQAAAQQGLNQRLNAMLGRPNQDAVVGMNIFAHGSSSDLFATVEPWLAKYADIPFFLYLHSVEPHDPYDPVKEDWSRFLTDDERTAFDAEESKVSMQMTQGFIGAGGPNANAAKIVPLANAADYPAGTTARRMADNGIEPKIHRHGARSLYDAEILFMDRYVQSVVDRVQRLGLWDDLVFSFNADHGEEFLDHNNSGHGHSVYAELNHVPWILRAPGILAAGTVVKDNVANLDLAPTLLGLCGLTADEGMQGRDLVPALAHGEEFTPTPIVTENWNGGVGVFFGGMGGGGNADEEILGSFSVIEGRWKTIIKRFHKGGGNPGSPPNGPQLPGELVTEFEVYDLDADLADSHPVTEERREEAKATLARFEAWVARMRELHKRYAGENLTNADADATLRALGYAK